MNVPGVRALIEAKAGALAVEGVDEEAMRQWGIGLPAGLHDDVVEYLAHCLTDHGVGGSGAGLCGRRRLLDENLPGVSPGGELAPLGLLVIGTTIGGSALAVVTDRGEVVFADSSHFLTRIDDEYEVLIDGEWRRVAATRDGVLGLCTSLSSNLESFLRALLDDELLEVLERLD